MRKASLQLCFLLLAITGIHSFKIMQSGFINGKVYPSDNIESVVAVNGTDSVKVTSENGYFALMVKPGIWKVIVDAKQPYKNIIQENVEVSGGKNIDLGEMRLLQ